MIPMNLSLPMTCITCTTCNLIVLNLSMYIMIFIQMKYYVTYKIVKCTKINAKYRDIILSQNIVYHFIAIFLLYRIGSTNFYYCPALHIWKICCKLLHVIQRVKNSFGKVTQSFWLHMPVCNVDEV